MKAGLVITAILALVLTTGCPPARVEAQKPTWGVALDGYPVSPEMIGRAVDETGLEPGIVVFFLQWPREGEDGEFPGSSLEAIDKAGAIPCLTWEPMFPDAQGRERMVGYQDLLAGAYDPYLAGFARETRNWSKPLLIRFGHEMNLARYHWGTDRDSYGPSSPGIYKSMFMYVVELFRREKADNVRWVFCPNAESQPHPEWDRALWNRAEKYYPGDDYVDILGMDGYNWGTTQQKDKNGWDSRWRSFSDTFSDLHSELKKISPQKPMVIFETSSARPGGDRTAWIADALDQSRAWGVKGLVWFQVKKEVDWRLLKDKDQASLEEIRRGSQKGRFTAP